VDAGKLRLAQGSPKAPSRVQGGRKARNAGESAEAQVLAITAAAFADRARLRKRPTPTKRLPSKAPGLKPGQFIACFERKSGPDIDVHLVGRPGGLLEIKSTEEPSIALDAVQPDQAAELQAFADLGLLALVLVRVRGQWWLVPWTAWRSPSGRKSLGPAELDQVGTRCPMILNRGAAGPDWLTALEAP